MRVFLCFGDAWCVELQRGATVVGRDPACQVQLRDDAVSRRHLRLVLDDAGQLTAMDLCSTNGVRVNGGPLADSRRLERGDVLLVGHSLCTVAMLRDDDPAVGEMVRRQRNRPPSRQVYGARATQATCATCFQPMPDDGSECPTCARRRQDRRRDYRVRTRLPVRFRVDAGTFTSTAHDLSMGGLFLVWDRTPEPGPCQVTLLPDDTAPVVVQGQVCHVLPGPTRDGHPPGFGVKFVEMDRRAWLWLHGLLARHEEPWVYGESSSI